MYKRKRVQALMSPASGMGRSEVETCLVNLYNNTSIYIRYHITRIVLLYTIYFRFPLNKICILYNISIYIHNIYM